MESKMTTPVLLIYDEEQDKFRTAPQRYCKRCRKPAIYYWKICAITCNQWLCVDCDIEMNELILKFMKYRKWKWLMKKYMLRVLDELTHKPEGA